MKYAEELTIVGKGLGNFGTFRIDLVQVIMFVDKKFWRPL